MDSLSDGFYRAFEEKYRGSRELIKSRLRVYLPFIEPLKTAYSTSSVVDLGCGRGEWLELLSERGFAPHGVDLDEGMLAACYERGLQASKGDAINFLKALPDASQLVVSGFHIAEHLPFADLLELVQEALRVLRPAGLLILETPNPENLRVAGTSFYLDPTHHHPLPPELLSFLPPHIGFARTKVIRLQERPELLKSARVSLNDVLGGVSPDYAIVAQKSGEESVMALASRAFDVDYGVTFDQLVTRFDTQFAEQTGQLTKQNEQLARQAEQVAKQEEQLVRQAEKTTEVSKATQRLRTMLESELSSKNKAIETKEAEISNLRQELAAVYQSTSWQVTAPLRSISRSAGWVARGVWAWITLKPGSRPRRAARRVLVHVPVLRNRWVTPVGSSSATSGSNGAVEKGERSTTHLAADTENRALIATWQLDLSSESEGARRIYRRLVQARQSTRTSRY